MKGDWGSTELMEEEAAQEPSQHSQWWGDSLAEPGLWSQLWHPSELPPSETLPLEMNLARSLMLRNPKAAPALCYTCVTCINTTEIKREEYYMEEKWRGRRKLCSFCCIQGRSKSFYSGSTLHAADYVNGTSTKLDFHLLWHSLPLPEWFYSSFSRN